MTDRARYWQRLVVQWQKSGLSQAEFCRRRRIKAVSFGWWKRKLHGAEKEKRRRFNRRTSRSWTRGDAGFVEVALPGEVLAGRSVDATRATPPRGRVAPLVEPCGYEIGVKGGRVIRLPQTFDPSVVSQLIAVVESC